MLQKAIKLNKSKQHEKHELNVRGIDVIENVDRKGERKQW